ncbi:MAG: sel1 repeat family protein [Ignavibacteriales bacterium]|nr:sel1 repeat family protein [Ignavibacteriales bacterium]
MKSALRLVILVSALFLLLRFNVQAQRKTAPSPSSVQSMIKQSNLDYQLWESFELIQKANSGDAAAQHELGLRYFMGKGFSQDTTKGAYWVQKSANQDFLLAQYNLGILFLNGIGVDWNPFHAYKQFKIAAEKKLPDAQYVQGLLLTENLIVPRDWLRAYHLVKQAADTDFEPAKKALREFQKRGISGDASESSSAKLSAKDSIAKKFRPIFLDFDVDTSSHVNDSTLISDVLREASPTLKAVIDTAYYRTFTPPTNPPQGAADDGTPSGTLETFEREADAGSPEALTLLGRIHERGVGVQRDPLKAAFYYLRALRLESPRAYELLWNVVNEKTFAEELERKAKADDPLAQFVWAGLVAVQIERRLGADQPVRLLQASSDRQFVQATVELGLCYQSGRWVTQDRVKAEYLWQRAASLGNREAKLRLAAISVARGEHLDSSLKTLREAFEEGSILAQTALGYCHENGIGMVENKGEASRLYRNASKRGSENAYHALRRMHDEIRPEEMEFEVEE